MRDKSFAGSPIIADTNGNMLSALTPGQEKLIETISSNDITFVNGPSGTGKSCLATWLGVKGIDDGTFEKLILTRPVVTAGEELGFLPGSMDEKIAPYMQPLYDALLTVKGPRKTYDTVNQEIRDIPGLTAKEKHRMRADGRTTASPSGDFYDKVRVCPLAYIRGSTLSRSFIVCDEFQNTTPAQMKMMLTRIGRGSKMVICGDSHQIDIPGHVESGFTNAMRLLKNVSRIGFVELTEDDIVRHKLIRDIIMCYEFHGKGADGNGRDRKRRRSGPRVPQSTWSEPDGIDWSRDDEDLSGPESVEH